MNPFSETTTSSWRPQLTVTRLLIGITLLLGLIAAVAFLLLGRTAAEPRTAVLTQMNGTVELRVAGDDLWQATSPGQVLTVGDEVRTTAAATATITYFDGSITRLSPETHLQLTDLAERRDGRWYHIAFTQLSGQTDQLVLPLPAPDSYFVVTTAAARLEANGTTYHITVTPEHNTEITVTDGQVVVYEQTTNTMQTLLAGDSLLIAVLPSTPATLVPEQPSLSTELTSSPTATPSVPTPAASITSIPTLATTATPLATTATPLATTATPLATRTVRAQTTVNATTQTVIATPSATSPGQSNPTAVSPTHPPLILPTLQPTLPPATLAPTFPPAPTATPWDDDDDDNDNGNNNDDNGGGDNDDNNND